MAYLLWRVMAGLNEEVTIAFLLVDHTKFAPDLGFRTRVDMVYYGISDVVWQFAVLNHPQLIGDYDGNMFVMFMTEATWLRNTYTTAIKGINKYQHFQMYLGVVCSDCQWWRRKADWYFKRYLWKPSLSAMPPLIIPPPLYYYSFSQLLHYNATRNIKLIFINSYIITV